MMENKAQQFVLLWHIKLSKDPNQWCDEPSPNLSSKSRQEKWPLSRWTPTDHPLYVQIFHRQAHQLMICRVSSSKMISSSHSSKTMISAIIQKKSSLEFLPCISKGSNLLWGWILIIAFKCSFCCYSLICESQLKVILKLFSMDYPLWFGISCVSDQISTAERFCMPITGDK